VQQLPVRARYSRESPPKTADFSLARRLLSCSVNRKETEMTTLRSSFRNSFHSAFLAVNGIALTCFLLASFASLLA
jgi:hypothetical protein